MSNRRVANLISKFLAICREGVAHELATVVRDDPIGDTKTGNQSFDELDG
jgi:hypothetical protein